MQNVLADVVVSVSELQKNPSAILNVANGGPVAVLSHNRVVAYMVSADVFEAMMERLDDLELAEIVRARRPEAPMPVILDDL